MFGDSLGDTIRPIVVILDTEVVVSACIMKEATPLPYIFVEDVVRLRDTVPAGRPPTRPSLPGPTKFAPFDIDDETRIEEEIEAAVIFMIMNREVRHTHLREENLQQCIRDEYPSEASTVPPNPTRW